MPPLKYVLRDLTLLVGLNYREIIERLKEHSNPVNVEGMARFGINPKNTLGVSVPILRKMGRDVGTDHELALQLWRSGIHEARILASMVDDPSEVTEKQMERWAKEFDSWDVCDQCCMNLFDKTDRAHQKAADWASRQEEFVKRAGFAMMASLAVHDKQAADRQFERYLPIIERASDDDRNFVKKAVNWALRQIGKRNERLNRAAIATARRIEKRESRAARWIAADAIKELTSVAVKKKIRKKR